MERASSNIIETGPCLEMSEMSVARLWYLVPSSLLILISEYVVLLFVYNKLAMSQSAAVYLKYQLFLSPVSLPAISSI